MFMVCHCVVMWWMPDAAVTFNLSSAVAMKRHLRSSSKVSCLDFWPPTITYKRIRLGSCRLLWESKISSTLTFWLTHRNVEAIVLEIFPWWQVLLTTHLTLWVKWVDQCSNQHQLSKIMRRIIKSCFAFYYMAEKMTRFPRQIKHENNPQKILIEVIGLCGCCRLLKRLPPELLDSFHSNWREQR